MGESPRRAQAAPSIPREQITGLLLAGGRGSRMGGVDKGWLMLHGRPLAQHVLQRLRPQVGALLISANRHLEDYAALGAPVLRDPEDAAYAGPLAGIAAGLRACATPWLLSAPCDSPFLPADLAQRLGAVALAEGRQAAVARAGGRLQTVFALLHRDLLPGLQAFLRGEDRRVESWLKQVGAAQVEFDDPACFDNINLPRELDALRALPDSSA